VGSTYLNAANGANTARADAVGNAAIASGNSTANLFANAAQGIGTIYGAYNNRNPYNFGSTAIRPGSGNPYTPPSDFTPYRAPAVF
jgi:hypothetical protein